MLSVHATALAGCEPFEVADWPVRKCNPEQRLLWPCSNLPPLVVALLQHKVPDKLTDPTSVTQIHSITKQIGMLATGMHGRQGYRGCRAGWACRHTQLPG